MGLMPWETYELPKSCYRQIAAPSQLRGTLANDDRQREVMRCKTAGRRPFSAIREAVCSRLEQIYTIFEGTSDIQRLVIARAISGMRIT